QRKQHPCQRELQQHAEQLWQAAATLAAARWGRSRRASAGHAWRPVPRWILAVRILQAFRTKRIVRPRTVELNLGFAGAARPSGVASTRHGPGCYRPSRPDAMKRRSCGGIWYDWGSVRAGVLRLLQAAPCPCFLTNMHGCTKILPL